MKTAICSLLITLLFSLQSSGKTFKVAIKHQASSKIYAEVIKAIIEATGNNTEIKIYPASRAEYLISKNMVDIQIPQVRMNDKKKEINNKFDYSSIDLFDSAFILYCNKNKFIDIESLKKGNPDNYKIEADPTLTYLITEFIFNDTNDYIASLKKVSINRIDGFIMSQFTGDASLISAGVKNITRQLYKTATVSLTIRKGIEGRKTEKIIVEGYNKIKSSGKYDEIMGDLINKARYNDWQP